MSVTTTTNYVTFSTKSRLWIPKPDVGEDQPDGCGVCFMGALKRSLSVIYQIVDFGEMNYAAKLGF
jgi:hypothetical protein